MPVMSGVGVLCMAIRLSSCRKDPGMHSRSRGDERPIRCSNKDVDAHAVIDRTWNDWVMTGAFSKFGWRQRRGVAHKRPESGRT